MLLGTRCDQLPPPARGGRRAPAAQVAGRDRKVDIKPFAIQGLPTSILPTQLLTETLNDRQARVVSLNELKDKLEAMEGVQFKQFNSITEYSLANVRSGRGGASPAFRLRS